MISKKKEVESLQTLRGECSFLFDKIEEHGAELTGYLLKLPQKAFVIASAYALSNVYSCYEDIFKHIARVFENRIQNMSSWHSELLNRMLIEVPKIRPAVLTQETAAVLDEMRAFRHVFRSSYVFTIDAERVTRLEKRWQSAKGKIRKEIENFLTRVTA